MDRELVHQIKDVLRLRVGEECIISDGNRNEARCRIVSFSDKKCELEFLKQTYNANENAISATLYCSLLKKEHFETVVQKATEIGICEIVPLVCRRTVKLAVPARERLEKIMKEASEQSDRGIIPVLCDASSFDDAVQKASSSRAMTYFYHRDGILHAEWKRDNITPAKVNIFIGPEGGWDEYELGRARGSNFSLISLGPTVLRAETAAIIGSYLATH